MLNQSCQIDFKQTHSHAGSCSSHGFSLNHLIRKLRFSLITVSLYYRADAGKVSVPLYWCFINNTISWLETRLHSLWSSHLRTANAAKAKEQSQGFFLVLIITSLSPVNHIASAICLTPGDKELQQTVGFSTFFQ